MMVPKFWEDGFGRTAFAAFCVHSVLISVGMMVGYSAILIPQLALTMHLNSEENSWLASLGAITNPVGTILCALMAENYGRKISVLISCIPFFLGWMCIGFADHITLLFIGRLVTGVGAGMSMSCYTYVSEISTPRNRGFFLAMGPICSSLGIFLSYLLGYILKWCTVAFIGAAFSIFTFTSILFLPESPAYLYKIGNTTQSFNSYFWFRRNEIIAREEVRNLSIDSQHSKRSTMEIYLSAATIKPFLILVLLFFLQEMSGIYTFLFYAVNFFQETNLDMDNYVSTIIVGGVRFVMSVVTAILLSKFGRRILCLVSSAGMALPMLILVVYFKHYDIHVDETRGAQFLPFVCVLLNVVFSMVGMLPIPWILVGELFPLEVRAIMSAVVTCVAEMLIFVVIKIYPDMIALLDFTGTLMTFLVASIIAFFFCMFILPETKNRSLQEIEKSFRSRKDFKDFDDKGPGINTETTRV